MADYKKKKVKKIKPKKNSHPSKKDSVATENIKMLDSRVRRVKKRRSKLKKTTSAMPTRKTEPIAKAYTAEEKYRVIKGNKSKNRLKRFLKLTACLPVIAIILLANFMTPTGIIETASNFMVELGSGDDSVNLQSNKITDFRNDGGRISVLSDTYLELYNANAKQMLCHQHGFSTPQLKTSDSRVLVFDRGGKGFKIFNNSKMLLDEKLQATIISADISRNGSMAFVTESTGYLAQVSVFDKDLKNKFTFYSSEKRITDAALNNRGRKLAVSEIFVENGVCSSTVSVYNFSDSKPVFVEKFENEIITSLINTGSRILAVGSKTIAYLSWNGKHKELPSLNNSLIKFKVINNKNAIFVTGSINGLSKSCVSVYNSKGVQISSFDFDDNITDISLASDTIWILSGNTVKKYSAEGKFIDYPEDLSAASICLCGLKKNSFAFVSQAKLIYYK